MGSTSDQPDGDMTYEEMWAKAIEEYYNAAGYQNKESFYEENEVEIKAEIEKVKKIAQASGPPARCRDVVWNFAPQAINVAFQGASIVRYSTESFSTFQAFDILRRPFRLLQSLALCPTFSPRRGKSTMSYSTEWKVFKA